MRPHLKTFLIALITIGLIAWFFRQANLADVWREIRAAEPWALALALVMTACTYVLRALRWVRPTKSWTSSATRSSLAATASA